LNEFRYVDYGEESGSSSSGNPYSSFLPFPCLTPILDDTAHDPYLAKIHTIELVAAWVQMFAGNFPLFFFTTLVDLVFLCYFFVY
jgi:hypothetical protein